MTLVLKIDLDMVKMYDHTKNEVSTSGYSKVIAQTGREYENINLLHTTKPFHVLFGTEDKVRYLKYKHSKLPEPCVFRTFYVLTCLLRFSFYNNIDSSQVPEKVKNTRRRISFQFSLFVCFCIVLCVVNS